MLHSPSGFPSRISCRIIGYDFSSPDTFTYRLLKAVSCKYHVANLYCAGDFWAHTITRYCFPGFLKQSLDLGKVLDKNGTGNIPGTHGTKEAAVVIWQWHVGKFVQHKIHVNGKFSIIMEVCLVIQFLENLGIKHTN